MHLKLAEGVQPVPQYTLEKRMGAGTFGEVWRATGPGGVPVALKIIPLTRSTGARELRSILPLRDIRHPHLVPITGLWILDEHGEIMSEAWLVETSRKTAKAKETVSTLSPGSTLNRPDVLIVAMGLCEMSLADLLDQHKADGRDSIPLAELLVYIKEAAKGLDFLNAPIHQLGGQKNVAIQHRDVKPGNILLSGGAAVICDFGVACVLQDHSITATDMVGSPAYMAPESIEAKRTTHATDQYALAVTYYELRTGDLPFNDRSSQIAVMNAHLKSELNFADCPDAERAVLKRATAFDPADRFASCTEMVEALEQASHGVMPRMPRHQRAISPKQWAAVATLLVIAGLAWIWKGDTIIAALTPKPEDQASGRTTLPKQQAASDETESNASDEIAAVETADGSNSQNAASDTIQATATSNGPQTDTGGKLPNPIENSIGMVLLPLGPSPPNAGPRPFISKTEVTQAQWEAVMGTRPWEGQRNVITEPNASAPASYVSWFDAVLFCRRLSDKEGRSYRLPTESEWEFACRAGGSGTPPESIPDFAWFKENALRAGAKYPHPVATKSANPWGFHDMHGNVHEWCEDAFGSTVSDAGEVEFRVLRGGSWADNAEKCGLDGRTGRRPEIAYDDAGFRVTLEPQE